ncbi:MAG TPA: NAD-glutamate dehydrogenase domain-containing protein, partial [Candidatus Saccharimonadia bacterium]|nr:NAD-glutamate dehydrogenase domain-containing protein [Candidatus Saccharimonadia bacterium]
MNAKPSVPPERATVEAILEHLKGRQSAPRQANAQALGRAFFKRVPFEDLTARGSGAWCAVLSGLLEFMQVRRVEQPIVRVFNPTQEEHGWDTTHTVIEIVTDDSPFLVDSVTMAIASCDTLAHSVVHPVVSVERDAGGHVLAIRDADGSPEQQGPGRGVTESIMHFEVDRRAEPEELVKLTHAVEASLRDVRGAVRDWKAMRAKMLEIAQELATRPTPVDAETRVEAEEFLRWVADDHFTFLGYREYEVGTENGEGVLRAHDETGLGILRGIEHAVTRPLKTLAAHEQQQRGQIEPLILTKTNARSTVHRPGYMDYIGVLKFGENGRPIGEQRFLGLYTSSAYNRRPWEIPLVRHRYEAVMRLSGLTREGHSGKALRHILETLPREELFQATAEELAETALGILALSERQRTRLFVRRDRYGRFFSILVFLPRDRFDADVRARIEELLKQAFKGERLDSTIQVSESALARLHAIVRPRSGERPDYDIAELEQRLSQLVRNWHDELRDVLTQRHGEEKGLKLANRYGKALPAGYIEEATPFIAANDVEAAAALRGPEDIRLSLYRPRRKQAEGILRFKLFRFGSHIALSDALPMMENMGLKILSEHPYEMRLGGSDIYIQDFEVMPAVKADLDVDAVKDAFQSAFERIWRGEAENDGFNRLILRASLDWRQVSMLRAYCKYLLQTGMPFSQAYMEETLCKYPLHTRLLVEAFEAKFDPARDEVTKTQAEAGRRKTQRDIESALTDELAQAYPLLAGELADAREQSREKQTDAMIQAFKSVIDRVGSLDEDRILRSFLAMIGATLRTGYFQTRDGKPKDYISFKLDPAKVPDLPKPRPYREIWVFAPRVEGVHLRFGPVARGGLRWSDRREDFRTEVLGLVKAQMVKNTVIVPVGAKGGFIVKKPPLGGDRDAQLAEGIACYRIFINALLDITDNLVDGRVVNPRDVVRHDGDDPYLVVAADKGTATFSDIANSISLEHGYWMGDAFASGGSVGYDHKGMGITAKGGWESVKRHFRALGRDCQSEDFTVAGVGDMSGDVFGNGMLLSKHIRLVAAFDHRHIFLDPNPDAAVSFRERARMFELPRSSWEDYDSSLISAGGGVFSRSLKTIPLTAEVKDSLGIDPAIAQMTPAELMNAILKAPVDLFWNGGIGTYVKASSESHGDVGDRANNSLRVNGRELRCKVVGEGGNLGMTQRGRIEAALNGVLLNTDFIDNSAGVDTSDHEVNIKILLNEPVLRGELAMDARNTLLGSMTDEVEYLVLRDNYLQNQAISVMERMSVHRLGAKQHFIRTLETQGLLDRQLEFLPSDAEFADRKSRGLGLTRPELSILLSYSKIVLFQQLLDSDVPEDPFLSRELVRYFPKALQERHRDAMERHRLRREIIATSITNSTVNRMGATFVMRMQEDTGETPGQIAKAYTIAREVFDARELWSQIEALDGKVHGNAQIDALLKIWNLMRHLTRWLLNLPGHRLDIAAAVDRYAAGMQELRACLPGCLAEGDRQSTRGEVQQWIAAKFPEKLAEQLSSLHALMSALDIIEVARVRNLPVRRVAEVYYALGE